jgi:hypothetical protein
MARGFLHSGRTSVVRRAVGHGPRNHEPCGRGGEGWRRLLDPHRASPECAAIGDPYGLHLGGLNLLVLDSADADDFSVPAEQVATSKAFALERFGFSVLERTAAGWDGTLYDINDAVLARCKLSGRALECQ